MKAFQVAVSTKGAISRVRVEGFKNTEWLLDRLTHWFVFKTSESLQEDTVTSCFTFSVIHSFQMTQAKFERLLASIPEVRLTRIMAQPGI